MYQALKTNSPAPRFSEVRLGDFFKKATGDCIIPVDNTKVFLPDRSWSMTFAAGLEKCNFTDKIVTEVGVGSGINMAGLMLGPRKPKEFIGVDLAHSAVEVSRQLSDSCNFNATLLQSDLLDGLSDKQLKKTDRIIACIPQVPRHKNTIESERDFSDYYEETGIPEDAFGLGLVARLLDQSAKRAPQAELILNVANRPGGERIKAMFDRHGFVAEPIHRTVVQQDPTTSLASLAEIESHTGIDFHFYGDAQAKEHIKACEAETRRKNGIPIYHNIYVLAARLG